MQKQDNRRYSSWDTYALAKNICVYLMNLTYRHIRISNNKIFQFTTLRCERGNGTTCSEENSIYVSTPFVCEALRPTIV